LRIDPNEQAFEISDFNHLGIDFENKEALELLMRKIYKLPENQKTVIILLKIEDLSQKEVADIMQISEGAVESLFQRAKTNLKKVL
jgi:RNA polymerase sigma-70 factor (ECF subfamily)